MLAVDKPAGWTSHDVVTVARRVLGTRRVGHGGTLDPLATGLLPLLVGAATRQAEHLHRAPKVYAALVRFGAETATDDREGAVRRVGTVPAMDGPALDAALERFRGEVEQVPPDFAAVKVGGRRAYRLARAGTPVLLGARTVLIERLAIASWRPPSLRLLIVCGSGTYVRALARDIGRHLGSAAHLWSLRRLAVGALSVGDAVDIRRLRAADPRAALPRLRAVDDGLLDLDDRYRATPAEDLLNGWEPS